MQIVFVIYSLQAGGAERVMSIMANYWAGKSEKITIITLDDGAKASFYNIDPQVKLLSLGVAAESKSWISGILNNINRLYKLRKSIREAKPDAVISFLTETNILSLISTLGLNLPVVVSEHTDPLLCPISRPWEKLRYKLYPLARRVVVLNKRAQEYFTHSQRNQVTIMPNPVVIESITGGADPELNEPVRPLIIAMGRLSQEKRFDLLLRAFSDVVKKHNDWNLMILGEGPERTALELLRAKLGLEKKISLPGAVRHPHAVMKQADMFVLSSELEGFPMALCEAMACGLPVIASEYNSAVRDIVEHQENGILVPPGDAVPLTVAMDHLIDDRDERKRLAENAIGIGDRFSVDTVMEKWEKLLQDVMSHDKQTAV